MKSLISYINEALKSGSISNDVKSIDKKIREFGEEKRKDKAYKVGNEYNSDFQIEYQGARVRIEQYNDFYAYPGNEKDLKDGDCPKDVKVLVKFNQLLSRDEGTKEAYQLFDTTNGSTREKIGRSLPFIFYSPDKDQLFDANFKKISKPGKAKSESFTKLFCELISAINTRTQYTEDWFNK